MFAETKPSVAGEAWARFLVRENLATHVKVSELAPDKGLMLPDDWLLHGLKLTSLIQDLAEEGNDTTDLLSKACVCFRRAGHPALVFRAVEQLWATESIARLLRMDLHEDDSSAASRDHLEVEKDNNLEDIKTVAIDAVLHSLHASQFHEAARLCERWCDEPRLVKLSCRVKQLAVTRPL